MNISAGRTSFPCTMPTQKSFLYGCRSLYRFWPSWRRISVAMGSCLSMAGISEACANSEKQYGYPFPRIRIAQILQFGHLEFSKLINIPCNCRAKTALLTNTPWSMYQLAAIDRSGFGAQCLEGTTKNLGFPVHGNFCLNPDGQFEPTSDANNFLHTCQKQLKKMSDTLDLLLRSVHSIRIRIIFFNTHCLSLFYYVEPIHFYSQQDLRPLYTAMAKIIPGRHCSQLLCFLVCFSGCVWARYLILFFCML